MFPGCLFVLLPVLDDERDNTRRLALGTLEHAVSLVRETPLHVPDDAVHERLGVHGNVLPLARGEVLRLFEQLPAIASEAVHGLAYERFRDVHASLHVVRTYPHRGIAHDDCYGVVLGGVGNALLLVRVDVLWIE